MHIDVCPCSCSGKAQLEKVTLEEGGRARWQALIRASRRAWTAISTGPDVSWLNGYPAKYLAVPSCAEPEFSRTPLFRMPSLVLPWKKSTKIIPTCPLPRYSGSFRLPTQTGRTSREGLARSQFAAQAENQPRQARDHHRLLYEMGGVEKR